MEALQEALINLLVVVIGLVATFVGQKGYSYLNNKGILKEIEAKQKYVNIVVNAIQQTYKEANGEEKLGEAKTQLVDFFNANGIKFTDVELNSLIEAAVKGVKDGAKKVSMEEVIAQKVALDKQSCQWVIR